MATLIRLSLLFNHCFNSRLTLRHPKKISEWALNSLRRFSIIFSPLILPDIPAHLNHNLNLFKSISTSLQKQIFEEVYGIHCFHAKVNGYWAWAASVFKCNSIQFCRKKNFLCTLDGTVWPSYTWKSRMGDDPVGKKKAKEKKFPGISRSCGQTTAWQSPNKVKVC